jgi:hypothetical protein
MPVRPITFGDEGQVASREMLRRLDALEPAVPKSLRARLATLESLDRQYGGSGRLELEDVDELVASIITELATLPPPRPSPGSDPGVAWLGSDPGLPSPRSSPKGIGRETVAPPPPRPSPKGEGDIADIIIGVALWAIRHEVPIAAVEPLVNALADRSNNAKNKQELAAVFGLMQGVIAHVRERLSADLERSNPERPWRLLHANFAITAIRTEDPELIDFAFDALDLALPDERANFYAEALALALSPRIPAAVRERIEQRHLKWAPQ